MVTVGQLIEALHRCDKSAPIPINMGDGSVAWLTEIRISNETVVLTARVVKDVTNGNQTDGV